MPHYQDETLAIHTGYQKDNQRTMAVPLYLSTAYAYKDIDHAARLFDLEEGGNIYTRLSNPTTQVFEDRVAALEGGEAALACASGMAAVFYAVVNVAQAGDNILSSTKIYGGTSTLFAHTLKRFGIETRFFNPQNPQELEKLIDDKTRLIYVESISNPSIDVPKIEEIVSCAKKQGVLSCVDNTVATPVLFKPFDWGFDISLYSASKYMDGQGLNIIGVLAARKNLNAFLKNNPRYPQFSTPDPTYHGLVYTDLPASAFILRARLGLLRDIGAVPSPFGSFLLIQGLETLALRMEKHSQSALAIAKFLKNHKKVKSVKYPGLKTDANYPLAQKYFKGCSGLLSFELGTLEEAKTMVGRAKIFSLVTNIGDSKSLFTHPASTTHRQLSDEELEACGVSKGLIRLSIGLENTQDLIQDLEQALDF